MSKLYFESVGKMARYIKVETRKLKYRIEQAPFNDQLHLGEKGDVEITEKVLLDIKEYINDNRNLYNKLRRDPNYINALDMSKYLGISFQDLLVRIKTGIWDTKILAIPRLNRSEKYPDEHYIYFFDKDKSFEGLKPISLIAKDSKIISHRALYQYAKKGYLPQPHGFEGTRFYDEKEIVELLPQLRLLEMEEKRKSLKDNALLAYDLLNKDLQIAIDEYIEFRRNNGVIEFSGYRTSKKIAHKDQTLSDMKNRLSCAFVNIICFRNGIKESILKSIEIYDKEKHKYDNSIFDFKSVSEKDYFFLQSTKKGMTLIHYYQVLRPFYYYYLDKAESLAIDSDENYRKFLVFKRQVDNFLKQFPRSQADIEAETDKKIKAFLSRAEQVEVKNLLLTDPRSTDPVKNATMWQFSCQTGVRPEEIIKIKIEYFLLDKNGFIKIDENGYGVLDIPKEASKQERSPSHRKYKTVIPKDTVNQLNVYLSQLYAKQGPNNEKGKGYLFRKNYINPYVPYTKLDKNFINRIRQFLKFLTEEQQRDFVFKSSRHSMNNLISTTYLPNLRLNGDIQRRVAQYQMRHSEQMRISNSSEQSFRKATTAEVYYTDEVNKEDFYEVLNYTINFPWDLEELSIWERELEAKYSNHYHGHSLDVSSGNPKEDKSSNTLLRDLENQINELTTRPKNMSVVEWMRRLSQLKKERDNFEKKGENYA